MKPVDKEKKRYVLFEIESGKKRFSFREVERAIISSCKELLGEIFTGEAGINVMKEKFSGKRGIIRVNNRWVKYLKVCLGNIYQINGEKVSIQTKKVSGLLNKLQI